MYKTKEQEESLLTPIEMRIENFHDFARNLAAAGALRIIIEGLEEAQCLLDKAEADPVFAAKNASLIKQTEAEVVEAERAIVQLAEYYNKMGFCA